MYFSTIVHRFIVHDIINIAKQKIATFVQYIASIMYKCSSMVRHILLFTIITYFGNTVKQTEKIQPRIAQKAD